MSFIAACRPWLEESLDGRGGRPDPFGVVPLAFGALARGTAERGRGATAQGARR